MVAKQKYHWIFSTTQLITLLITDQARQQRRRFRKYTANAPEEAVKFLAVKENYDRQSTTYNTIQVGK